MFIFVLLMILAGLWLWLQKPPTAAEQALMMRVAEMRTGEIAKTIAAEKAFWATPALLDELEKRQVCYNAGECSEDKLLTFIRDNVINDATGEQLKRVAKISDFYFDIA